MLTVKDYILIWTIFKLCNAFIINNDRNNEEGKTVHYKDNFNEFIKQSKNVITLLNEDILKSNKILDRIAADSNRMDRMSGLEDQQIKKIEDQLDSKALDCLGSAQLIDENVFQLNEDSNLKVDQTTEVRRMPVSKKKKISSKALQGLYRQVFSHISFQDSTQNKSHAIYCTVSLFKTSTAQPISIKEKSHISLNHHLNKETFTTSLDNQSDALTTQPVSNKETSTASLDNQSDALTTQPVSNKETSTASFDNHSDALTTQSVSNKEIFTTSLDNQSDAPTTQPVSNKETSTTSLDNQSDAPTTQPVSNKETSTASLDNQSDASTTQPVSTKETSMTSLDNHSDASTTQPVSHKETSTSLDNRSEASTTRPELNKELPQVFAQSKVIPVHHLNISHICIDIQEICKDNETQEHIKKHSEENPDERAKTDTTLPINNVITTIASTTRKNFYPSDLTLSKPKPSSPIDNSTARPVTTLAHMEFIGQVTCRWVCDDKNMTIKLNETKKKALLPNSISNRKRESFPSQNTVFLSPPTLQPSLNQMGIFNTTAVTSNQLKTIQVYFSEITNQDSSLSRDDTTVEDIQNSTCSDADSSQKDFMPAGITMTCAYTDLPTATPEICTTSLTTPETCEPSTTQEELTTSIAPEISDLPIQLGNTTSNVPEVLTTATTPPPETLPSTERVTTEKPAITIQTTKLERNVLGSSETIGGSKPSATKRAKKWSLLIPVCLFTS